MARVAVSVDEPERLLGALSLELEALEALGVRVWADSVEIRVTLCGVHPRPLNLEVHSRGYSMTRSRLLLFVMAASEGKSTITDHVWRSRFGYAEGIAKFGAEMQIEGSKLLIRGQRRPWQRGASVTATDLRAAACLTLAAVASDGESIIEHADHVDRGFAEFDKTISYLGGSIIRER